MKRGRRSKVWPFFDCKKDDSGRTVNVVCKLCDAEYKYHGTTSNLKLHLEKSHPLQWGLSQESDTEESNLLHSLLEEDGTGAVRIKKKKSENTVSESEEVQYIFEGDDNQVYELVSSYDPTEEWIEGEEYDTSMFNNTQKKIKIEQGTAIPMRERVVSHHPSSSNTVVVESNQEDECSLFGQLVSCKLRNLKERTRGNIQQLITTILWQAEYGMYDNNNTIKDILLNVIAVSGEDRNNPNSVENQGND